MRRHLKIAILMLVCVMGVGVVLGGADGTVEIVPAPDVASDADAD